MPFLIATTDPEIHAHFFLLVQPGLRMAFMRYALPKPTHTYRFLILNADGRAQARVQGVATLAKGKT
jgi:hypothetical protein